MKTKLHLPKYKDTTNRQKAGFWFSVSFLVQDVSVCQTVSFLILVMFQILPQLVPLSFAWILSILFVQAK